MIFLIFINILFIVIALYVYHNIGHPFWCSAIFSLAKLLSYFVIGGYPWWGCLLSGAIVYLLSLLYFWLLSITQNKPFLYWIILIIGFCLLIL